jgi:hypothetical protein
MRRISSVPCILAMLLCSLAAPQARADDLSPSELYVRALAVMQRLPEPPYVSYRSTFSSSGMRISLARDRGYASLYLLINDLQSTLAVQTSYQSAEQRVLLGEPGAGDLVGLSPIFNPTWTGAYQWVRYGLQGKPPTLTSARPPVGPAGIATITVVDALSPGAYIVDDGGAQSCPNGAPGEHLQLRPRWDPMNHPLTDVVIDDDSSRFCSMRFGIASSGAMYTLTGYIELHFSSVANYWLVTGGNGNVGMQIFGRTYKQAPLAFAYTYLAFAPESVVAVAPRKPTFTAALFRRPTPARTPAVPAAVAAVATATLPPTIAHVATNALCETLQQNVLRAVAGLHTNDAIFERSNPMVLQMGQTLASVSHFGQSADTPNTMSVFSGKNDIDPSISMNQVQLSRLAQQIARNLQQIEAALNDPTRFPTPPRTRGDLQAAQIKAQLEALAQQQKQLLDAINGLADTTSMQQMMAQGDGMDGAINEGGGSPAHNKIVGTNDTALTYNDPLDTMDPGSRNTNPTFVGGTIGGPKPNADQAAGSTQIPNALSGNPLGGLYANLLRNQQQLQQAEGVLSTNVKTAAAQCP